MTFSLHPDLQRDSVSVEALPDGLFTLCDVRHMNDVTYPWFLLVPRVPDIRDTIDLSPADHARMWAESRTLSTALMQAFDGDKLNVAALGNMTPQLHLHHIVRYASDPAWPGPIWGKVSMRAPTPDARADALARLRSALQDVS